MSSEVTTTNAALPEVIVKKRAAWADMGQLVHQTEQQLNTDALALIAKLVPPTKPEELLSAENTLKEVAAGQKTLIELRKQRTSVLDAISSRLMNPEKTVEVEITKFKAAVIAIKKIKQAEDEKIEAAKLERANARNFYSEVIIKLDAAYKKKCSDNVLFAYNWALDNGITMETLPEFIAKVKTKFKEGDFIPVPEPFAVKYDDAEQIAKMAATLYEAMQPPAQYIAAYHTAIDNQFEFYNVALNNKEAAKIQADQAKAKADADAAEAAKNAAAAAQLENIAVEHAPDIVKDEAKKLKVVYAIDMEDTETTALQIMAAFTANLYLCRDHVRVKSWQKLSVEQMGAALAAVKNKDENFKVNLIKFKTVDKL